MPEPNQPSDRGAYQVLARRYRSRSFEELVGQEAIMRTLRKCIRFVFSNHEEGFVD